MNFEKIVEEQVKFKVQEVMEKGLMVIKKKEIVEDTARGEELIRHKSF